MQEMDPERLLKGKGEDARVQIAQLVGQSLANDDLAKSDQRASEMFARALVQDAVERVRCELSKAIRHAKHLPRELALKLAHDVDAVSCPFLEVTEVFSDSELQQLLLTITRGASIAIAQRSRMSESLAQSLAQSGDSIVAETLLENPTAPMTEPVCHTLMDRFASENWVLDKMALRDDLITEIAIKLTAQVSVAMREKLVNTYRLPRHTEPLADEAETGAVLQIIRKTAGKDLIEAARVLMRENRLTPQLLQLALQKDERAFLEAGFSVLSGRSMEHVRSVINRAGPDAIIQLLRKVDIPEEMHGGFQQGIELLRSK